MNELTEPIQLPLGAPDDPAMRVGIRSVIYGLAQYVAFLPDSLQKRLCFEVLDRVIMRLNVIGFDEEKHLFTEEELAEMLEAIMGFVFMLYNLQPEEEGRQFIVSWSRRMSSQLTVFSEETGQGGQ